MQRKNHHVVLHRSELLAQVKTGAIHARRHLQFLFIYLKWTAVLLFY
jgi:hypothetical protein